MEDGIERHQPGAVFGVALGQFVPYDDHGDAARQADHDEPDHVLGIAAQEEHGEDEHEHGADEPVLDQGQGQDLFQDGRRRGARGELEAYQERLGVFARGRVFFYPVYDLEVPFFKDDVKDENGNILEGRRIPRIRWNDGSTNTQEYFKGELGGCGFKTTTHVVSQAEIDQIGLTGVGLGLGDDGSQTQVFEPSSYENDYYTDAFNIVTYPGEEAKTLADFVHPYFYFQDAFDRWIEATSIEIIPPVECGKPVIYLYPEQVTDMTVWVNPKGGFSYTEPLYKNGWRITASPDGKIVNQDDGLEYPYLFWEGRGGMYSAPEHYWVVKQTEVETFLTQILDEMEFFENERNDFLEFWLPRMQEAPYYKIGFHGTEVMNQLAPLQLSVKPDHIFRILMDYSPLEHWLPSDPPTTLPHANREGFDVMEWGGVLR